VNERRDSPIFKKEKKESKLIKITEKKTLAALVATLEEKREDQGELSRPFYRRGNYREGYKDPGEEKARPLIKNPRYKNKEPFRPS